MLSESYWSGTTVLDSANMDYLLLAIITFVYWHSCPWIWDVYVQPHILTQTKQSIWRITRTHVIVFQSMRDLWAWCQSHQTAFRSWQPPLPVTWVSLMWAAEVTTRWWGHIQTLCSASVWMASVTISQQPLQMAQCAFGIWIPYIRLINTTLMCFPAFFVLPFYNNQILLFECFVYKYSPCLSICWTWQVYGLYTISLLKKKKKLTLAFNVAFCQLFFLCWSKDMQGSAFVPC